MFYYATYSTSSGWYGDWYTKTQSKRFGTWPMKSGDTGYIEGLIDNPCPSGWKVPTYAQLNSLIGNPKSQITGKWDTNGFWVDGTQSPQKNSGIFLPAAGYRGGSSATFSDRYVVSADATYGGDYWSSTTNGWGAYYLLVKNNNGTTYNKMDTDNQRSTGYSVRCVKE